MDNQDSELTDPLQSDPGHRLFVQEPTDDEVRKLDWGDEPDEHQSKEEEIPVSYCDPPGAGNVVAQVSQQIANYRQRPLLVLTAGFIDERTPQEIYRFRKQLKGGGTNTPFDVLLHSPGGDLTHCYRVARLLAQYSNEWQALIPAYAASGATLIALGSSCVIVSEFAQLGPMDPQVMSRRPSKFFMAERQSPIEAFQAMKYLQRVSMKYLLFQQGLAPQTAVETASKLAIDFVKPILEKIEPYDLGSFAKDNRLALDYCRNIASPRDSSIRSQRRANIDALVEGYTSHEFFLDAAEARQLGFEVEIPDENLESLFDGFRNAVQNVETYVGMVRPEVKKL
jgi:hypothetical protein